MADRGLHLADHVPLRDHELVPDPTRDDVWARIQYFLYQATEPVLRPVRRIIRPMAGLDFSFLVVILVAQIVLIPVLRA